MRNYHSTSGPAENEEIQSHLKISVSPLSSYPSSSRIRCRTKLSGDYTKGTQPAHVLLCTRSVSSPDHLQYPVQGSEVSCAVYRVTRRKTCPSMFNELQVFFFFVFACIVCLFVLFIFNWHGRRRPSLIGCNLKSSPCGLRSNDLKASESEKTFSCLLPVAYPLFLPATSLPVPALQDLLLQLLEHTA